MIWTQGLPRAVRMSLLCATSVIALAARAEAQIFDAAASGFYAGISLGSGSGGLTGDASFDGQTGPIPESPSFGMMQGTQIGYDAVLTSGLLVGFELGLSDGSIKDSQSQDNFEGTGKTLSFDRDLTRLALVQGKIGVKRDKISVFGLGGLARAEGSISGAVSDFEGTTSFSGTSDFDGWTLGVGANFALSDHVSIGAAYNYLSLSGTSVSQNDVTIDHQDLDTQIAKLVLNFTF